MAANSGMNVKWLGVKKLEKALKSEAVDNATRAAVSAVATDIAARADELVPFDTGNLSRSQDLIRAKSFGPIIATIEYGGTAAPYALVQHENQDLSHPPASEGGSPVSPGSGRGPKYLQYPATEAAGSLKKRIVAEIKLRGL
jgi:hypothetical protein